MAMGLDDLGDVDWEEVGELLDAAFRQLPRSGASGGYSNEVPVQDLTKQRDPGS
jgi:hypothetical protein